MNVILNKATKQVKRFGFSDFDYDAETEELIETTSDFYLQDGFENYFWYYIDDNYFSPKEKHGNKNFIVKEYNKSILKKEVWYQIDNKDGTYSDKIEETEYFYDGSKIIYHIIKKFLLDGTEESAMKYVYYTNSVGDIILKPGDITNG
jgi:hypothetical protein